MSTDKKAVDYDLNPVKPEVLGVHTPYEAVKAQANAGNEDAIAELARRDVNKVTPETVTLLDGSVRVDNRKAPK